MKITDLALSYSNCLKHVWDYPQGEVKLLLELLPKYVAHVEKYPHTLLVKFFGLYRVIPENGSKVSHHGPEVNSVFHVFPCHPHCFAQLAVSMRQRVFGGMCCTLGLGSSGAQSHSPPQVTVEALVNASLLTPSDQSLRDLRVQVRFIVMNNVFQNALPISKQYDLKGSTQGRTSTTDAPRPNMILKDLDLDIKIKLEEGWHDRCESLIPSAANEKPS